MKWIALVFIAIAIILAAVGSRVDKWASFEGGGFIIEIILFVGAVFCAVVSVVLFSILVFQSV